MQVVVRIERHSVPGVQRGWRSAAAVGVLPWCVNKSMADSMIRTIMLALVLFPTSAAVRAQTLFAPVEYVTGDREWKCHGRCLGTLAMDEQFIRLTERRKKNPRVTFSPPLSTITRATNRVESRMPVSPSAWPGSQPPAQTHSCDHCGDGRVHRDVRVQGRETCLRRNGSEDRIRREESQGLRPRARHEADVAGP